MLVVVWFRYPYVELSYLGWYLLRIGRQELAQVEEIMKKVCMFNKKAGKWVGKLVEWIVCKDCQKKLFHGHYFVAQIFRYRNENLLKKSYG